ncbi:MAG: AMP-binding protein [Bacteroidetes bacterium]|nr:AMP-binding protein [Bacteroidota bacterium]
MSFEGSDRMVNRMPLYHDMGLVGYHLSPIFGCFSQYHIDPMDFIKRPFIWLDIIDKCKITINGCPNFGQALLLRHLKRNKTITWDLSSLKAITNGAEPISVRIMNEFIDNVKPHKFRPEAMMPVYGMAESTLAITFSELLHQPVVVPFRRKDLNFNLKAVRADHIDSSAQLIPSVGKALNNIQYRIVNDEDQPIKESNIGHIQIKGPCVTSGYYNNPEVTQKAFCGDWLRTGDQGFVFEGNLYITGRYKDIIFIHGKNFYAHDLEHVAQSVDDVSFGKAFIGGIFDETKGHDKVLLFLVGSVTQETMATFNKIRNLFLETLGISIDVFIPIRSNHIPKTSSGKIQRYKLISAYMRGEFDDVINEIRQLQEKSS